MKLPNIWGKFSVWLKRIAFFSGVTIAVGGPIYFGYQGAYPMVGICFAAGFILLLCSRFDDLARIRIIGVLEYELHKKKEEVDKALTELQAFAQALSKPTIKMALQLDPMHRTLTRKDGFELAKNIESSLRRLGVDDDGIRAATEPYYSRTLYEICWPMNDPVSIATNKKIQPLARQRDQFHDKKSREYLEADAEVQKVLNQSNIYRKYFKSDGWKRLPYEIEEALKASGMFDPDEIADMMMKMRSHIDRAQYFIENRDFKPGDRWLEQL